MTSLRVFQEGLRGLLSPARLSENADSLWHGNVPQRLDVYKHSVLSNWTDTLDYDFPLTRQQFSDEDWWALEQNFFKKNPPRHWELNTSMTPFVPFLKLQKKIKPWIKELADYEWNDMLIFIDRTNVRAVASDGPITNPTIRIAVYQHQIFDWVQSGAEATKTPAQKPEVLAFYRDRKNTCHIQEADPLMLLFIEHFRKSAAILENLEPLRRQLLPGNLIPLENVMATLRKADIILD